MYAHRTYIQMLSVILILAVMVTQTHADDGDTTEKPEVEVADSSDATDDVDTEPENVVETKVPEEEITTSTTTETIMTTVKEESEAPSTEEAEDLTTPKSEASTKEEPPESIFRVLDSSHKICMLAKFSITFHNEGKEHPLTTLPENAESKGTCEEDKPRDLHLSWHKFRFTMVFSKDLKDEDSKNKWAVSSLVLSSEERTAKSKKQKVFFETPLGKSYSCQSPEVIKLISKKGNVTVKFHDIRLQPFEVEKDEFSPAEECDTVAAPVVTEEPFVQDETVPLAVGLTLAILTLLVVLGFAVYRAYTLRKVDYNSME